MHILFDIGASKTRVTLTDKGEKRGFLEPVIFNTPDTLEETASQIKDAIEGFGIKGKIEGAFGGVSGVWDRERKILYHSPNKPTWSGLPVKDILENELSVSVVVDNDAEIVGLGEAVYGAGKDYSIVAYMTISTGCGGARIVNKKIDSSTFDFEPGFQIIDFSDENEYTRTLEGRISGSAFFKKYNMEPYKVLDEEIWERAAEEAAIGIYNSILHWTPDVFVLGGSMIVGDPAISVERIKYYINKFGGHLPELPEIKKAELGVIGGIYGALAKYLNI